MDETRMTVRLLMLQAVEKLEWAADLLRGPETPPSAEAMELEKALTRAIETLGPSIKQMVECKAPCRSGT